MNKYLFQTTVTMKPYNNKKWWIDSDIIRDIVIEADNINKALGQYQEQVSESGINISDNALRTKEPMYITNSDGEDVQIGYVITGKSEFKDDVNYRWSTQYVDMWLTILTITDTEF